MTDTDTNTIECSGLTLHALVREIESSGGRIVTMDVRGKADYFLTIDWNSPPPRNHPELSLSELSGPRKRGGERRGV